MDLTTLLIGGAVGAGAVKVLSKPTRTTTARKSKAAAKKTTKKATPKKSTPKKVVAKKTTKKATTPRTPKVKQTGSSNKKYDSRRQALPPGTRISKNGNVYTETRANRSDTGKLL